MRPAATPSQYKTSGNPTATTYGKYTILTYKNTGSASFTPANSMKVGYIVVGGGSASQSHYYGGTGGGVSYSPYSTGFNLTGGKTYPITVGAGGVAGTLGTNGGSGAASTFNGVKANGGTIGISGGTATGGTTNMKGADKVYWNEHGKNGPAVAISDIGVSTNYGGGGGGGNGGSFGGKGGLGGGGAASQVQAGRAGTGTAGTANTGGGGGACTGWSISTTPTAAGGSGVVVIFFTV